MCARIKGVNREVFRGKSVSLTTVCFLLTRANKERRTGNLSRVFSRDAQGFGRLDAGSRAGYTSSRPPPPCVCVCVFFPFILDIKFVGRTSRGHTGGRSHRIFHLSAVRALFFLARRIQPFLSLVDREVEFCVLTI